MVTRTEAKAAVSDIRVKAETMQDAVWGLAIAGTITREQKARMADILNTIAAFCDDLDRRVDQVWPAPP